MSWWRGMEEKGVTCEKKIEWEQGRRVNDKNTYHWLQNGNYENVKCHPHFTVDVLIFVFKWNSMKYLYFDHVNVERWTLYLVPWQHSWRNSFVSVSFELPSSYATSAKYQCQHNIVFIFAVSRALNNLKRQLALDTHSQTVEIFHIFVDFKIE